MTADVMRWRVVRGLGRGLLGVMVAGAVMAAQAAEGTAAAAGRDLAGTYVLEGQREAAASLTLAADGRFRFAMSYGAVDTDARGTWTRQGNRLVLTTDAPPEPSFSWAEDQAAQAEQCMGGYASPERPPVLLVACVATPDQGLAWENVEVTAHFTNGRSRSGLTTRHGQLGFLARTEPEWQGAQVERLTVSYPRGQVAPQSFPVPPGARTAVIRLEPGRLTRPAAEQLTFEALPPAAGPGAPVDALTILSPDGTAAGIFRRR